MDSKAVDICGNQMKAFVFSIFFYRHLPLASATAAAAATISWTLLCETNLKLKFDKINNRFMFFKLFIVKINAMAISVA